MRQNTDKSVIVYNEIDEVTDLFGRGIVRDGLVLDLDAGISASYSGSGDTWTDLSASGNNGTLTNGPTYSSTNGGSFVFDGSNNVSITGSITVSAVTFSVWLKRNGTQYDFTGILNSRGTNVSGMIFAYNYGTLGYNWNDSNQAYYFNSGLTPPNGAWCMCVVTVTSTEAKFYLCQSSGITTATNTMEHASTTLDALKLALDDILSRYFKGTIAQASVYNRALTAAEVSQNFNALKGRFGL
jgi:hypothetical protein